MKGEEAWMKKEDCWEVMMMVVQGKSTEKSEVVGCRNLTGESMRQQDHAVDTFRSLMLRPIISFLSGYRRDRAQLRAHSLQSQQQDSKPTYKSLCCDSHGPA